MALRRNHGSQTANAQFRYGVGSLAIYLTVCTLEILLAPPVTGQPGFLSIDCGSTEDYTDNATGIYYQTDAKYVSTGINVNDIYIVKNIPSVYSPGGFYNGEKQLKSLRYFDNKRDGHNRDCYALPTKPQQLYLIRFVFLLSNWTNLFGIGKDRTFDFDIYLNSTLIRTMSDFSSPGPLLYEEVIFSSTGHTINVCLVRKGSPSFINTLELRELGNEMYGTIGKPQNSEAIYFVLRARADFGAPASSFCRYPNDTYDRWWLGIPGFYPEYFLQYSDIYGSNLLPATPALAPDLPPAAVLDSAIVTLNTSIINIYVETHVGADLPGATYGPMHVTALFQELDGSASSSNVRGIDLSVNGRVLDSVNASKEVKEVRFSIPATNLTYSVIALSQASWSRLPPILNAMEMYYTLNINTSRTARNDVDAVSTLAARVPELQDLYGDPCLPTPYFWVQCIQDAVKPTIFRVSGLLLDNLNISGPFPKEIFEFKNLSILSLSQNQLKGSIPDLSELSYLQTLSLRDNNLDGNIQNLNGLPFLQALDLGNNSFSGAIPSFLSSYSYLSELHLDNNYFSGDVPEKLDSKIGLNFTYQNNPGLRVSSSSSSKSNTGPVVGGLVGGTVGLIVMISIVWCIVTRKKRATSKILKNIRNAGTLKSAQGKGESASSTPRGHVGSPTFGSLPVLSLQQVSNATQKFSRKIGEGSFGPVYYGTLPGSGQEVAAKVKSGFSRQGLTEFKNELALLSRIHHGNLVSLAGYCEEADQQILIYAYLCNGSLRDHLSGKKSRRPLDWKTRLRIAVDSATGLEYLHFHCYPRIIHRDVKSTNILLDKNMVAKVADFGISKPTLEGMTSGVDTRIMGTPGYIDPEYFINQRLTQKSDVYSFGVVLLEILSGQHPLTAQLEDGTVLNLAELAKISVEEGNVVNIFDKSLTMESKFNYESAKMVLDLALESLDPVTLKRPDMRQVLQRLMQAAALEDAYNPTVRAPHGNEGIPAVPSMNDFENSPKRLIPDSMQLSHIANDMTEIEPR